MNDDKLTRLLRASRAELPELSPDPHLPARVRAMARERAETRRGARVPGISWARVSLGTAALALALAAGGIIGYRAATSRLGADTTAGAAIDDADYAALESFAGAWSQSGFADEWNANAGVTE